VNGRERREGQIVGAATPFRPDATEYPSRRGWFQDASAHVSRASRGFAREVPEFPFTRCRLASPRAQKHASVRDFRAREAEFPPD